MCQSLISLTLSLPSHSRAPNSAQVSVILTPSNDNPPSLYATTTQVYHDETSPSSPVLPDITVSDVDYSDCNPVNLTAALVMLNTTADDNQYENLTVRSMVSVYVRGLHTSVEHLRYSSMYAFVMKFVHQSIF